MEENARMKKLKELTVVAFGAGMGQETEEGGMEVCGGGYLFY